MSCSVCCKFDLNSPPISEMTTRYQLFFFAILLLLSGEGTRTAQIRPRPTQKTRQMIALPLSSSTGRLTFVFCGSKGRKTNLMVLGSQKNRRRSFGNAGLVAWPAERAAVDERVNSQFGTVAAFAFASQRFR
ncbi:hypothetical protein GPALN_011313 [Globodera pallida]|nr:hypothetical protein GPALN_011313 [Globodera pallida]